MNNGKNRNDNRGFTIIELVVSFSLTMIVIVYLLKTIVVVSNKNQELLTLQEYEILEATLLSEINNDIKKQEGKVEILEKKGSVFMSGIDEFITFNNEENYITYKDTIYELPEGVKIANVPYTISYIEDESMISDNVSYNILKLNLIVNNKERNIIVSSKHKGKVCKRATSLHTENCQQTDTTYYCSGAGYSNGEEIVYGNLGTKGTEPQSGDAFDCDVNGDGNYDEDTERFYYVTEENSVAVLIYYNNFKNGQANNTSAGLIAYDGTHGTGESAQNWHGPITAITNLPKNSDWKNVGLTKEIRAITNQNGGNTTTNGANTLPSAFSYEGYAARLLTAQEVNKACGITIGSHTLGELDQNCTYLLENTKYSSSGMGTYGFWLENPHASYSYIAWSVNGYSRNGGNHYVSYAGGYGVRPAIEVPKSYIEY